MKTTNDFSYTYIIERTSVIDYTVTAIDSLTGYSVKFAITNLRFANETADYWRGQVADYTLDGGFDHDVFICELFADGYECDDEDVKRVIENCRYEFVKWMDYIHKAH